ncbi:beta-ketoacyl-[acyl-carrier-protein] synthase family protein [Photobacterium sanguinicancri]|uniref:beta-ketoacyl-[acyl-carrier-protein] synthase family protein n=1 Tax=Photobacterium sanguinicancri TaxID=875932 RepID=UPI0021C451D9|nr:beta-ketoacyl-[acyl-carrier-protein] synthase family protein [Photobacterium sanguinicancri]MDO6498298.1 beta-ketoacyl-[acyl-carrier-protein] synthase family protein [Photobacterium sanguinicancri]
MNQTASAATPLYIHSCGFHSALGLEHNDIHARLAQGHSPDMQICNDMLNDGTATVIGKVTADLPALPAALKAFDTYNNRLAQSALAQMAPSVAHAITQYGSDRIAVVVGSSTSGIADGETALKAQANDGEFPSEFHYHQQELGNLSEFIADFFQIQGPTYTVSTACSSSGRVFLSAQRLLQSGLADAVIVGGADSLCKLTLNGFHGLEALSSELCNPFSANRKGINIGEAAAFMLLSQDKPSMVDEGSDTNPDTSSDKNTNIKMPAIALLGAGDSSDAHHISAPHPEGNGAEEAMQKALTNAQLTPSDIGYINAHGTATPLNDEMEAKAIHRVFGELVPVSSTKPFTGHTLGAASAVEAAICWHVLRYNLAIPQQINDGERADSLAPILLAGQHTALNNKAILSNSFAFGGNNISLIFGYVYD